MLTLSACNGDDDPKIGSNDPGSNNMVNNDNNTGGDSGPNNTASDMGVGDDMAGTPDMTERDMAQPDMAAPDMMEPDMSPDMGLVCGADEMECGGVCATCPAPDNVDSFVCNGMLCEVGACAMGFVPCDTGCCTPPMPAMSGWAATAEFTAIETSIALDPNGYPRISYRNFFNTNVEHSAWDGRQWVVDVVETGVDPALTNIAIDDMGRTHMSWFEADNGALRYARQAAGGWQVQTVASQIGGYNSLELDSQGRPHLVYQDQALKILKHTRWDGAAWVTTDIYTNDPSTSYNYAQLSLDAMDRPRVAFSHFADFALRFAAWDGSAWQVEDVPVTGLIQYVDLALDAAGVPTIVFRMTNNLRLARRGGTGWTVTDVDTSGNWGRTSVVRIDSAGYPRILTHGNMTDTGRIFSFDGAAWQTIDVLGGASITGGGASFVLDSTDAMHVSLGTKMPPIRLEYLLIP